MITKLSISQMYGIDQLSANLGDVVLIEGANGTGKTSVLSAILKMVEGGHDPGVLRRYCAACSRTAPELGQCECGGDVVAAEKGSVEIELDNGCRFLYECTPTGYALKGWNETKTAIKGPKTHLERMLTLAQVSPGEILRIDASTKPGMRELRAVLQRLIPLSFSTQDLPVPQTDGERESVLFIADAMRSANSAGLLDLDLGQFDKAASAVRESRRTVNSHLEDKTRTVAALQSKVDLAPDDVSVELASKREQLAALRSGRALALERHSAAAKEQIAALRNSVGGQVGAWLREAELEAAEIRRKAEQQIAELSAAWEVRIERARSEAATKEEEINKEAARIARESEPEHVDQVGALSAEVERLEGLQRGWVEAENTRKLRSQFEAEARRLSIQSVVLDRAAAMMERMRIEKLANLPIPGLEVGADYVRVDGVDWEKLNTAKRMWLCIRICAKLSAETDQKIIILDHGEAFDTDTYAEVSAACKSSGFQLLIARVSDAPKVRIQ